jgi:hypothetical protein
MGGACSANVGIRGAYTGFWWGKLRDRDHLEDPGIDGRIILRWILRKWGMVLWTRSISFQDRDRWRAFVNAVMNLRVP